jgi:succinyl-CoA synthetase beta subunit
VLMFSLEGGIDIEQVPSEKIQTMTVDIFRGVRNYDACNVALKASVPSRFITGVASCIKGVYDTFIKYDCRIAEVNPLVQTKDGQFYAADCRISIDDSSAYKHPELQIEVARELPRAPTELEKIAWKIEEGDYRGTCYIAQMAPDRKGLGYVGYHGVTGGGAILGVDALSRQGLKIANYADTSGNPTASKVYRAAKLIMSQPDIEGFILAGFVIANQEQWHHAHGLLKALWEEIPKRPGFPVLILLCGNKEKESLQILREGLKELPARLEIYGSERVYDTDFIAKRMRALVDDYRMEKGVKEG